MDVTSGQNDLLLRLLSASTERTRVIANNIANQNTPGFTRKTLQFERLLKAALESGVDDLSRVRPSVEEDRVTPPRADGNNVNVELEMNALRENRLLYEAYSSILGTHFELVRASIESGR
jgi:flagellar basal-body rod protein FlgB